MSLKGYENQDQDNSKIEIEKQEEKEKEFLQQQERDKNGWKLTRKFKVWNPFAEKRLSLEEKYNTKAVHKNLYLRFGQEKEKQIS